MEQFNLENVEMEDVEPEDIESENIEPENEDGIVNEDAADEYLRDMPDIPAPIIAKYKAAMESSLPDRSIKKYIGAYNKFLQWQAENNTTSMAEEVLVAYFMDLSVKYAPTTMWSVYSMLKRMIIVKNNVNLQGYCQLRSFLKTGSDGYESKKAEVFSPEEIREFLTNAPDEMYLAMKAIMSFGVSGASRGSELTNLKFVNVKENVDENNVRDYTVFIPDSKTKKPKRFVICGEYADIVHKYIQARPTRQFTDRFFINYRNGQCTHQVMGKNTIANTPKLIAKYLGLPEPKLYTGHSYRRSSASIFAESGASIEELKAHGGWKSSVVAEGYVDRSITNRRKFGNIIAEATHMGQPSIKGAVSSAGGNGSNVGRGATPKRMATSTVTTSSALALGDVFVQSHDIGQASKKRALSSAGDISVVANVGQGTGSNVGRGAQSKRMATSTVTTSSALALGDVFVQSQTIQKAETVVEEQVVEQQEKAQEEKETVVRQQQQIDRGSGQQQKIDRGSGQMPSMHFENCKEITIIFKNLLMSNNLCNITEYNIFVSSGLF